MLEFCQWLQSTALFVFLRGSGVIYPSILALHMVAIAFFGGMILMTDLRLLGLVMKNKSISDVVNQFRAAKWFGFALIVTCGVLMFGAKAEEYYYNVFFRTKMILLVLMLVHGMIFRGSVYRNAAELDRAPQIPGSAKAAAALSLVIWLGLVIAGRGIGYIEPPFEKLHAGLLPVPQVWMDRR